VATVALGAAVHIVDSSISGVALTAVGRAWASADVDRPRLLHDADLLLRVMRGTWANVLTFFSGVPFVCSGLAVALSSDYPKWFGGIAVGAGGGSIVAGMRCFLA
jgi:hypothetical protein